MLSRVGIFDKKTEILLEKAGLQDYVMASCAEVAEWQTH